MSVKRRCARAGAAALVVGWSIAGPDAVGIASADNPDADSPTANSRSGNAAHPTNPPGGDDTGVTKGRRRAPSNASSTPHPAAEHPPGRSSGPGPVPAAVLQKPAGIAVRRPQTADSSPVDAIVQVPVADRQPTLTTPVIMAPSAAATIAVVTGGTLAPVTGAAQAVKAAAPTSSPTALAAAATISAQVTHLLNSAANWLSSLPRDPVTDFLQGGLLLVRRGLFPGSDASSGIGQPHAAAALPGGSLLHPVATVNPADANGTVTGAVNTPWVLDYPPVYSGTGATSHGWVAVNPDGTFTYTPTAEARYAADHTGPTEDTFTVTVDDLAGDTVVTVPVTADSDPMGIHPTTTIDTTDHAGTVTGHTNITADYTLTYAGTTTTAKGTATVNPDGTFTYTPTNDARLAAAAPDATTTGADRDTFTITVTRGAGPIADTTVTVAVSAVPIAAPDPVPPDPVAPDPVAPTISLSRGIGTGSVVPVNSGAGGGTTASETDMEASAPARPAEEPVLVVDQSGSTGGEESDTKSVAAPASAPGQPARPDSVWHDRNAPQRTFAVAPVVVPLSIDAPRTGPGPGTAPKGGTGPLAVLSQAVVIQLQVAMFALMSMLGSGAMLRGITGLAVPGGSTGSSGGRVTAVRASKFGRGDSGRAFGDGSRTWRWPGTARIDAALQTTSARFAPHSPLAARIVVDGSAVRAIFGSAGLLLGVAGLAMGVAALRDTAGFATPPAAPIVIAIAILAVFDALAGFLAVTVFAGGVLLSGHLTSAADVRTMLGLSVIWFAVPIIAGAARPLRRAAASSVAEWRAWVGDLVIASLIGAWAVQKMITALPGLAGVKLPIAAQAKHIALLVLAACAIRIAMEACAARWYPGRLAAVQPEALAQPPAAQRIAAAFGRTALLLFVVAAFLGLSWQLWVGGLLFLAPQVISVYDARFPNSPTLYRFYPRGVVKLVIMLVVGMGIAAVVRHLLQHSAHPALDAFVLLAIPGAVLSLVEIFGREGPAPEETWPRWLAGAGFVATGVWLVLFVL